LKRFKGFGGGGGPAGCAAGPEDDCVLDEVVLSSLFFLAAVSFLCFLKGLIFLKTSSVVEVEAVLLEVVMAGFVQMHVQKHIVMPGIMEQLTGISALPDNLFFLWRSQSCLLILRWLFAYLKL